MKMYTLWHVLLIILICGSVHAQGNRTFSSHNIFSESLSESRIINVSLPDNYQGSDKAYPVLYVLDGEYVFTYAVGAVDFLSNPFGHLPKMIVVGIPNIDRNRDLFVTLNPEDGYMKFLDFLESEVLPFINQNYRTNGFNILYGWSSGSGISGQMFATRPHLFDGYIQTGTGVGPRTSAFFRENVPKHKYQNNYLYANCEGLGPRVPGLKNYSDLIEELNPEGLKWKFDVMETSTHVDVLAEGLYEGLRFIFADFYIPDSVAIKGVDAIISYFQQIDSRYNYDVEIPEGAINEGASILFQQKKHEEAIKLLLHGIESHRESSSLPSSLGEVYEAMNKKELAAKYYKMALENSTSIPMNRMKYKALFEKVQRQQVE